MRQKKERSDMRKRPLWFIIPVVLLLVMLLPFTAAAATNAEIIAIMNAGITGLRDLVRDAYCAVGVTALCP